MNKSIVLGILAIGSVLAQESPRDIKTASIVPPSKPSELAAANAELEAINQLVSPKAKKAPRQQKKRATASRPAVPTPTFRKLNSENLQNVSATEVPFHAKAGECYAKVMKTPGEYKSVSEKAVVREAYKKIDIIPAKFAWVNEKVVVEEAAETLVKVPAVYKVVEEKTLLEPAKTVWKKGTSYQGLKVVSQKTTESGEIMCLVEEPAKYSTISKKVMVSPEQVKKVQLEAKYMTIKVKKLIEPAKEVVIDVPAEYKDEEKQLALKNPEYSWSRVVCSANLTSKNVQNIQLALQKKKAYQGPINGKVDDRLLSAASKFASESGLPHGNKFIALEVIDALNIKL